VTWPIVLLCCLPICVAIYSFLIRPTSPSRTSTTTSVSSDRPLFDSSKFPLDFAVSKMDHTPYPPEQHGYHRIEDYYRILIYGTLQNPTEYPWEDFQFLIEYFDAEGNRIDFDNTSLSLNVPASTNLEVRLESQLAIDPKLAESVKVTVTHATVPYSF
jgi:hypothetical protein